MNLICSWSGGKDSCFALMKAINNGNELTVILNMMNENNKISRSHGIPKSILQQQTKALNTQLVTVASTWNDYENNFIKTLQDLKTKYNAQAIVFGDIDIEQHKEWEEKVSDAANLTAILPLWQQDRKQLVYNMIDAGIKAILVSCNNQLGKDYLGRLITRELVDEFESIGVDACGENGEYHTLVIDCPLFNTPIELPKYSKKNHDNYNFIVWDNYS